MNTLANNYKRQHCRDDATVSYQPRGVNIQLNEYNKLKFVNRKAIKNKGLDEWVYQGFI